MFMGSTRSGSYLEGGAAFETQATPKGVRPGRYYYYDDDDDEYYHH